jgi:Ni,Fe-hydrogenase I large subunit
MLNMNLAEGTGIGPGVQSTKGFHHVRIGDSQVCWYKPVIPATQEAGGLGVQGQPGQC